MFIRNAFNYDVDEASVSSSLRDFDESKTKQEFVEECDINTIVRRFGLTGELPVGVEAPTYADYSDVTDFQSAMNAIAKANEAFDAMPAEVRARFANNPAEFVDFCSDVKNKDEMEKLGLLQTVTKRDLRGHGESVKMASGSNDATTKGAKDGKRSGDRSKGEVRVEQSGDS